MVFKDVIDNFIKPVTLKTNHTRGEIVVTLYVVKKDNKYGGIATHEYRSGFSNTVDIAWDDTGFWWELMKGKWNDLLVVPNTISIHADGFDRCLECCLLYHNVDEECLKMVKQNYINLYSEIVAFLNTEGVEYGF